MEKFFEQIKLQKGDIIYINLGLGIKKAKVLVNDLDNKKIVLKLYFAFLYSPKMCFEYSDDIFNSFETINLLKK